MLALFCGVASCGKSVLAAVTINDLQKQLAPDPNSELSVYAFCRVDQRCTAQDVLFSIVKQALENLPSVVYPTAKPTYDEHVLKSMKLEREEAADLFASIAKLFAHTYLVIDGLDEIEDEEKTLLLELLAPLEVCLLIFSKPLPLFRGCLPPATALSIEARNEDIERFVLSSIKGNPRLRRLLRDDMDTLNRIVREIQWRSYGMHVHRNPRDQRSPLTLALGSWLRPCKSSQLKAA